MRKIGVIGSGLMGAGIAQVAAQAGLHVLMTVSREFSDPKYRPPILLRRYVTAGWLGRKSGKGFYDYAPPSS